MNLLDRLVSLPKDRRREVWWWLAIGLISFLWFWFWRSNVLSGGDSEQWEREIGAGVWLRKRQMLSFATLQLVYRLGRVLFEASPHRAISFVSCLAGALAVLVLWRMFRGRPHASVAILVTATAGFTTLFYGHIETYAQPVAALLFHLLALQRVTEGRWRPWTAVATFGLALAFHLVALFALPALALFLIRELRRPAVRRRDWRNVLLAAIPAVLFWLAITRRHYGGGELVGPHFIQPLDELIRHPWYVFTRNTAAEKWLFVIWNGGAAPFFALWIFARAIRPRRQGEKRDPLTLTLLAYFVCFLGFFAVWNPDAQTRDFDLFCFPWVIASVAVSRRVMELPARGVWVGLILGVNFYLFLSRPAAFAEIGRRGHGTILVKSDFPLDEQLVLLDERLALRPVNRYIVEGGYLITARGRRVRKSQCAINLRPGQTCTLHLDPSGIHLEKQTEP